jgi:O-antigen ligase
MNKLYIFILLLFSISFIPAFGAIDKATTHWFFLSILPLFFFFISFNKIFIKSKIFLFYSFFILQVFISLFYTNNFNISVVDFSRHLILFSLLLFLISLLNSKSFSFYNLSLIISFFLFYEVLMSLRPLYYFIVNNGFDFSIITSYQVDSLKGLNGNRNITTASIVIKLPFLIYLIYQSKIYYKFLFSSFAFLPALSLFLINSRAALLSFILFISTTTLFILFFHRKKFITLSLILMPFFFAFLFADSLIPDDTLNASEKISSIAFTNESSSYRFFIWENAFDYISQNPFIGCGIGNWKVESAAYWSTFGVDYLVPYHAHNDFLEFSTELGVIGGLTYLGLFLLITYKSISSYFRTKDFKYFILLSSFAALFIDSLLNFPFERPFIQVMFLILLALNIHYDYSNDSKQA